MSEPDLSSFKAVPPQAATHKQSMPGEGGVWIIIFGDMMVFALFFATFVYYRGLDIETYNASQATLDKGLGLLNTLILLTSSWFVVWAIRCAKSGDGKEAAHRILAAAALGVGFWVVKIIEYAAKFEEGYSVVTDEFFGFYFMFTGIHLVHVTAGLGALVYAQHVLRQGRVSGGDLDNLVGIGAFWHMVDLLWIVLFAILYLMG